MTALGLLCCTWTFCSSGKQGLLSASRLGGFSVGGAQALGGAQASGGVVRGLTYPRACGIFLDQGIEPMFLHGQADS